MCKLKNWKHHKGRTDCSSAHNYINQAQQTYFFWNRKELFSMSAVDLIMTLHCCLSELFIFPSKLDWATITQQSESNFHSDCHFSFVYLCVGFAVFMSLLWVCSGDWGPVWLCQTGQGGTRGRDAGYRLAHGGLQNAQLSGHQMGPQRSEGTLCNHTQGTHSHMAHCAPW